LSKDNTSTAPVRIANIQVKDLFNSFNYDFSLKSDERITILTAPNGFGKSTILRLTKHLIKGEYRALNTIPFREFLVRFTDGRTLRAARKSESGLDAPVDFVQLVDSSGKQIISVDVHASSLIDLDSPIYRHVNAIVRHHESLERIGIDEVYDHSTSEVMSYKEVLSRYSNLADMDDNSDPTELDRISHKLPILYIPADRLRVRQSRSGRPEDRESPVDRIVTMVQKQVHDSLSTYAQESRNIDSTFTQRVLTELIAPSTDQVAPSFEQLAELAKTEERIENSERRFRDLGIFGSTYRNKTGFNITDVKTSSSFRVRKMHFYDIEQKFLTLDKMAVRLEVFLDLLSQLYDHKKVRFTRAQGLYIETESSTKLDLNALSSGEQHLLVLYGTLLFGDESPLVMLDEPEISLHLEWQMNFLGHLQKIIDVRSLEIIIATHSPFIIDRRDDLIIELKDILGR
jgi:predicted ATPase